MSHVSTGIAPAIFLMSGFAATQAEAAVTVTPPPSTTTQTFNLALSGTSTDVVIGNSKLAQFSVTSSTLTALGNSQIGAKSSQFPTADTTFTAKSGTLALTSGYQIKFDIDGISNIGLVRFDGTSDMEFPSRLTTVEYRRTDGVVNGAVPEPDTWALMIAGFGAVGTAMRLSRRRRPQALAA